MDPKGVRSAWIALVVFSLILFVGLFAYFVRVKDNPWNWKSILTLITATLTLSDALLVWRMPSRAHALFGIVIMFVSLARVGHPRSWTIGTGIIFLLTMVLAAPLVNLLATKRNQ